MLTLRNKGLGIKSRDRIAIGVGLLIFFVCVVYTIFKQYDISNSQEKTSGVVIEFYHSTKARFGLKYRYQVNNNEYIGSTGVSPFKCEDGSDGCVGQSFTVYYSTENPQHSKIDLGKYEKHKTTVEFFD